jgi:hypothetical protein
MGAAARGGGGNARDGMDKGKGEDQDSQEQRRLKLEQLRSEHRDLDDVIHRLLDNPPFDQLQVQRLKKRKLVLKDQIAKLEALLIPDIIA